MNGVIRRLLHSYPVQFSKRLDQPRRDWADRIVLIASTPRSGSHFLGHALQETGECGVPLEYLHPDNVRCWHTRFGRKPMPELFAEIVRHRTTPNGTFCVKAHWNQFKPHQDDVDRLTRGLGIDQAVWILRRDVLSQAVSYAIAQQTGAWISGAREWRKPVYSYDDVFRMARRVRAQNRAWSRYFADRPVLKVVFEEFRSDPDARARLGAALGIDAPLDVPQRTKRQASSRNDDWKARFRDDIRDDHAWILEPAEFA